MNTKDALRDIKLSIHELEARLDKLEKDAVRFSYRNSVPTYSD